ncbi:MAG: type 2 periplasmic-binding domain-containing protein [Saccharofermentanales bacterium]
MNYNKSVYMNLKIIIMLIAIVIYSLFTSGCVLQSSFVFPAISYTDQNSVISEKSEFSEDAHIGSGKLKVALPMSLECLRYLSLMFIGEASGLFKDVKPESNGLNISLDTLDDYSNGFKIELISVADTGITDSQLLNAYLSNNVPDIMLIKNENQLALNHISSAQIESSYTNQYFSTSSIFPSMVPNGIENNSLHMLPYYASVKMMFANETLFTDSQSNSLLPQGNRMEFATFKTLSRKSTKSGSGIFGMMGLPDFLAFLPSTIASTADSFMWDGFRFDYTGNAFARSVSTIRNLISTGIVEDSLSASQKKNLYGSKDPRSLNKIGFWIDDSDNLDSWSAQSKSKLKRYPIQGENNITIPLSVYSIAVNSNSKLLKEAKRFATYLAFDNDALLFRSRYPNPDGFIPPVKDKIVWENLVKPQIQGDELFSLYDDMGYAKSVTNIDEEAVIDTYDELYVKYFNDILYNRKNLTTLSSKITDEANLIITKK